MPPGMQLGMQPGFLPDQIIIVVNQLGVRLRGRDNTSCCYRDKQGGAFNSQVHLWSLKFCGHTQTRRACHNFVQSESCQQMIWSVMGCTRVAHTGRGPLQGTDGTSADIFRCFMFYGWRGVEHGERHGAEGAMSMPRRGRRAKRYSHWQALH